MNNFEYVNPVKIVFGKGSIEKLAELIPAGKTVMMTYGGGSIKANGVYDQVTKALTEVTLLEFGGIEANPRFETCMKAVEMAKTHNVDFLLSVGGGSCLDGTKFIAAAINYEGDDAWEILTTHGENITSAVPLGAVLTLPATGSEMNCLSVISRDATDEKLHFGSPVVYPQFSILDPETTFSLPKNQVRNGIVDTFIHVMEQYATQDINTPLQNRQAEGIVLTLIQEATILLADEPDYDSRANFMWSATQALNGLIGCGVVQDWSTHMIGHEITAYFGLAHAETLAIVMPAMWKHQKENKQVKLAMLAERVFGIAEGDASTKADFAIAKTVEFFHSIDMPTSLDDYDITREDVQKVVTRFEERKAVLGENQNITPKEIGEILDLCF